MCRCLFLLWIFPRIPLSFINFSTHKNKSCQNLQKLPKLLQFFDFFSKFLKSTQPFFQSLVSTLFLPLDVIYILITTDFPYPEVKIPTMLSSKKIFFYYRHKNYSNCWERIIYFDRKLNGSIVFNKNILIFHHQVMQQNNLHALVKSSLGANQHTQSLKTKTFPSTRRATFKHLNSHVIFALSSCVRKWQWSLSLANKIWV